MTMEEGVLASPRDDVPYWLSNAEWSVLKLYKYYHPKWIQEIVFIYIEMHTCKQED